MDNKWSFPINEDDSQTGISDSGIETFREDMYSSLARETCQNSMDSFHLLSFFEVDYSTKSMDLLSSSYANNDEIIRATVESFMELEKEMNQRLGREEIRRIAGYLNIVGGINIIDYLDKDELKGRVKGRFYKGERD